MYALTADGTVVQVSNNGVGVGTWHTVDDRRFVVGFRTLLTKAGGELEGTVHVRLDCVLTGPNSVTATGRGAAYDPTGKKIYDLHPTATATRFTLDDV